MVPHARKFSDPVGKLPCLVGVFLRGPWAYIKFMKVLNPYRDRFRLTNHFFTGFFALSWLLLSSKSLEVEDGFLTGDLQKSAACSLSGTCQLLLPTTNVATSGTCHVVCKWNGTHMGPVVTDSCFYPSCIAFSCDPQCCTWDQHSLSIDILSVSCCRISPCLWRLMINGSCERSHQNVSFDSKNLS